MKPADTNDFPGGILDRGGAEQLLAESARRRNTLYEFVDRLHRAESLTEVYDAALDAITGGLGCDRAAILLFDEQGVMRFVAWRGLSGGYRNAVEGHSPWVGGERNPQPVFIPDVTQAGLDRHLREVMSAEGIGALGFIPLVVDGVLQGKFMTYQNRPRVFSPLELDLILIIARQLALSIGRKRTEEASRRKSAELQTLLDTLPVGVFFAQDPECRMITGNAAGCNLLRMPASANLSKTAPAGEAPTHFRICRNDVEIPLSELPVQRAARGEPVRNEDVELKFDDGSVIHCLISAAPLFDEQGKTRGAVATILDISERKQAEQALRQSEERLRLATETGKIGIWEWDIVSNRVAWTDSLYAIHGVKRNEFVATVEGFSALVHPDDAEMVGRAIGAALEKGAPYELTFRAVRPNGEVIWVFTNAVVLRSGQTPVRMLGATVDITELKRAEEALRASEQRLRQAQRQLESHALALEQTVEQRTMKLREMIAELQQLSYAITHDMRAPLRAMGAFGQLLLDEVEETGISAEAQDYCRRIVTAATRLDKLIQDALNYSKAVLQELPMAPVGLDILLRELIETYPNLHRDRADIHIEGNLPVVLGNESLLTQCFSNLLGNAVKFVLPGARPCVRVRSEARGHMARIWVEDNGIGIAKEAQSRLFGMFEKLDREYEGTGVGLAIVRKVTERMGGKVGVDSDAGCGSRFWVELRLAEQERA